MSFDFLFSPLLHGELGYWDEIANLIPFVVGGLLLIALYYSARKRRHKPPSK